MSAKDCTCNVQLNPLSYSKQTVELLWYHKWPQRPVLSNLKTFFFLLWIINSAVQCQHTSALRPALKLTVTLLQHCLDAGTHFLLWALQSYLQTVTAVSFTRTSCQLTRTKMSCDCDSWSSVSCICWTLQTSRSSNNKEITLGQTDQTKTKN